MRTILRPSVVLLAAALVGAFALSAILPWRNFSPASAAGVLSIDADGAFTCAITGAQTVKCWGDNQYGELGNGSTTFGVGNFSLVPVDVCADAACGSILSDITAIATGSYHACALTTTGGVKCWGSNENFQLGDGTNEWSSTPVDVVGLNSGVASVTAGNGHTCALMVSGGIKCWGRNTLGQLGDGTQGGRLTPVDVVGLTSGVEAVTAGGSTTCAIVTGGGVKCWGGNYYGELGIGTTSQSSVPATVGVTATAISAGGVHTCAITTGGAAKCWGRNDDGQLGGSSSETCNLTPCSTTPIDVVGLSTTATDIAPGGFRTCALTTDGGVKCWGREYGTTPVDVAGLTSGVAAVAVSGGHSCVLMTTGGVRCWGSNGYGRLGDGTTTDSAAPVDVVTLGPKPPTLTPTNTPTNTSTDTPTNTPVPATPTQASTPVTTATNTPGSIATPTPITDPVDTATPTLVTTPTPTATNGPASTPLPTFTPVPTSTPNVPPTVSPTLIYTPTPSVLQGDTSCDGVINPLDAALVLQFAAGMLLTLPCPGGGDASGDGVTNPLDAALILQFSAGLISSLPP